MIKASDKLKKLIKAFDNQDQLEKQTGLDRTTLYRLLEGDNCGPKVINCLMEWTGWKFEDAFSREEI